MRYMLIFKSDEPAVDPTQSPCKRELPEMAKVMGELKEQGILVYSEGLCPSDSGARVTVKPGRPASVMDGPFAEAKELIAGFAVVDVPSKAEAVALAERFLTIAGGGRSDVLEVWQPAGK